jgi:ankyrin repeat protein
MDLIDAVKDGDLRRVKLVIEEGADVNYRDSNGRTALYWAAIEHDRIDICRLLLDLGADVNQLNKSNSTVLMYAVYNSNIEIMKLLLSRGANLNIINSYGLTEIDYALKRIYNINVVRILYWRGAKCRNTNINGVLLLIYSRILPVDQLREIHTKWIS